MCVCAYVRMCVCAYVRILGTWEVWRALKRLELRLRLVRLLRLFRALQSPNFPRAQYQYRRTHAEHELIVNYGSCVNE